MFETEGLWAISTSMTVLVNTVLLEHSHVQLFRYCLGLLLHYNAELNGCNRNHMICTAYSIYSLGPHRKIIGSCFK